MIARISQEFCIDPAFIREVYQPQSRVASSLMTNIPRPQNVLAKHRPPGAGSPAGGRRLPRRSAPQPAARVRRRVRPAPRVRPRRRHQAHRLEGVRSHRAVPPEAVRTGNEPRRVGCSSMRASRWPTGPGRGQSTMWHASPRRRWPTSCCNRRTASGWRPRPAACGSSSAPPGR